MKLLDIVFVKMRISQMSKNIILNCKKSKRFNNVMDIEQAATGYLKQYIARATYLKAIINDNDKEPFFDNSDSDLDDEKNDDDFNDNDENDYEFNNGNNDIFTEENIQNAYRKALFHKNKK